MTLWPTCAGSPIAGCTMDERALKKYTASRAVPGRWSLEGDFDGYYTSVVVIPALAEFVSLKNCLESLTLSRAYRDERFLVVVVVNNRRSATGCQLEDNRRTLDWLRRRNPPGLALAWVDASSAGREIGDGEGVGLARKIGFDLALPLLDWRRDPLFLSLDADTLVDSRYFTALRGHFCHSGQGAAVIPFRHQPGETPQQEAAIRHYELYLRSYLFGLAQAGSPYAYHALGSAFACRAGDYVRAGGMNRRQAGEDFYFLQQLAKTVGVEMLDGTVVAPSSRFSSRVPFGTGQATLARTENRAPYRFLSAVGFSCLKALLRCVAVNCNSSRLLMDINAEDKAVAAYLVGLGFESAWQRICQNHLRTEQRSRAFHQWFDALKTRQFLSRFDPERADEVALVAELLKWGGYSGYDEFDRQLGLLEEMQHCGRGRASWD